MKKGLTDIHIHSVSFGTSPLPEVAYNLIKTDIKQKIMQKSLLSYHGLKKQDHDIDAIYLDFLSTTLKASKRVSRGVVFGLDGVYDHNGEFDPKKTAFMIHNDYVYESLKPYKNLYYAASINPARRDALDELDRVYEQGAILIKILPNVQHIDLAERRFIPFFRKLAGLKMPLLGHTGHEYAISGSKQKLGNLAKYRNLLEEEVTLVAAHGCSSGLPLYQNQVDTMLGFYEKYPHFYMDLSALSLMTRINIVKHLQKYHELKSRMFFGTDFPLPITPGIAASYISQGEISKIKKIDNYFDRYAAFLDKLNLLPENDPFDLMKRNETSMKKPGKAKHSKKK